MKGMTTCKVCGRDFPLMAEEHYIVQDPQKIGVLANLANTDKAMEYDAFDCPHCGCQNVMQERKPLWMPKEFDCTEDEEEDEEEENDEPEDKRDFLANYCDSRWCIGCPLNEEEFICGRGHSFGSVPGSSGYMDDYEIERHYKALKEAENE